MTSRILSLCLILGVLAAPTVATVTALDEAICPVCRVHEGERDAETVVATAEYDGDLYGFCSEKCKTTFVEEPTYYLPPVFPRPAPAFVVEDLEGADFSSEALAGRVVLLDFWATWCPPCLEDLPRLSALHERLSADGLTVVSVSIDEGEKVAKKVARMVKRRKATHPVFLDTNEASAWASYLVRVVPAQFLIDAEGNIVAQWSGKTDLDEVESEILRLLSPSSG